MTLNTTSVLWQWGAVLYGCLCIILNWYLGIIVDPHQPLLVLQKRDIGAALALPSISAFCFAVLPIIVNRALCAIQQSAENTGSSKPHAQVYCRRLSNMTGKLLLISLACATVIMSVYFYTEGLFYLPQLSFAENAKRAPLFFQAIVMWTGMIWGILLIYNITRLILRFMDKHLQVGVFSANGLFPIANTIYWNALFFCFGISLAPLFWLGDVPPLKDILMAMTVLIILINLMFQPLMRAHHILVEKKQQAILQYRTSKMDPLTSAVAPENGPASTKRSKANIIDEIIMAREWPFNVHLCLRFAAITVLPLVSWLGNSILTYIVTIH